MNVLIRAIEHKINTSLIYDPRLMTMHPPYFPNTGVWDTAYKDERHDMHDVADPSDEYWIGYDNI